MSKFMPNTQSAIPQKRAEKGDVQKGLFSSFVHLFSCVGHAVVSVVNFYTSGFKRMSKTSRTLWIIILIKLFIMFAVLKLFFFPNFLNTNFDTDEERSQYILESLTKTNIK